MADPDYVNHATDSEGGSCVEAASDLLMYAVQLGQQKREEGDMAQGGPPKPLSFRTRMILLGVVVILLIASFVFLPTAHIF